MGSHGVRVLSGGDYVVSSPNWDGAVANAGAATWGSGTAGVSGAVSAANSLVGCIQNFFDVLRHIGSLREKPLFGAEITSNKGDVDAGLRRHFP